MTIDKFFNPRFHALCSQFHGLSDAQTSTALHTLVGFLAQTASSQTPSAFNAQELAENALQAAVKEIEQLKTEPKVIYSGRSSYGKTLTALNL